MVGAVVWVGCFGGGGLVGVVVVGGWASGLFWPVLGPMPGTAVFN